MTWSSTATRGLTEPRRPLGELGGFGSLAFSIPLGLSAGRPFSPLSRAISARWAATVCSSAATLPSSSMTSAFSLVGERASRSPGEAILPGNQTQPRRGSENRAAATSLATGFAAVTNSLIWPRGEIRENGVRKLHVSPDRHFSSLRAGGCETGTQYTNLPRLGSRVRILSTA